MFFVLLQPILNTLIFAMYIGKNPVGLKIAIVNEELPDDVFNCDKLVSEDCNFSTPLSCRYLNKLEQKTYKLVR